MRHRKSQRREFVLQLFDRIEPIPDQLSSRGFAQHVRDMLQGHSLECPYCAIEPEPKRMEQDNHAQPVINIGGQTLGVMVGEVTTTLEAKCHECNADITYNIDSTGRPTLTSIETTIALEGYLGDLGDDP